MKTNIEQLEQAIARAFSSIDHALDLIAEHTDGPFEMTVALKQILSHVKATDQETSLLRDTVEEQSHLIDQLAAQRHNLIMERDQAYEAGFQDGITSVAAWRTMIAALAGIGQTELSTQLNTLLDAWLADVRIILPEGATIDQ